MATIRFNIRSLVLAVFVIGLILAVGLLTTENARLRIANQRLSADAEKARAATSWVLYNNRLTLRAAVASRRNGGKTAASIAVRKGQAAGGK